MARRYNTGHKVPSNAIPDMSDNFTFFDEFVNNSTGEVTTRTGKSVTVLQEQIKSRIDGLTETANNAITAAKQAVTTSDRNVVLATNARHEAAAAAASAQNIANANTYYITSTDPDGTIAGLAGTPAGQGFRVAQGVGADNSFIYYRNVNSTAVPVSKEPGAASVAKMSKLNGSLSPFVTVGPRNGVAPAAPENLLAENINIMTHVILDVEVIGALPEYYYRISYFRCSSTPGPNDQAPYLLQVQAHRRDQWATSPASVLIHSGGLAELVNDGGKGIRTYVVEMNNSAGLMSQQLRITIDTDAINVFQGQQLIGTTPSTRPYAWIIDTRKYEFSRVPNELQKTVRSKGCLTPFTTTGNRFTQVPKTAEELSGPTLNIMRDIILDVRVVNAQPGYYYRISYFNCNDEIVNGVQPFLLQCQMQPIKDYDTLGTYKIIHSAPVWQLRYDLGKGVQTYWINMLTPAGTQGANCWMVITIDTNAVVTHKGKIFAAVSQLSQAYAWIIDPNKYEMINDDAYAYKRLQRMSIPSVGGTGKEVTSSLRMGADPKDLMSQFLSGGAFERFGDNGIYAPPTTATIDFKLFTMHESSWDRVVSQIRNKYIFEYPFLDVGTTTNELAHDLGVFTPYTINESGILNIRYSPQMPPMRAVVNGHLDVWVRVPSEDCVVQLWASLWSEYNYNQFTVDRLQMLGIGSSTGTRPFEMIGTEANYLVGIDPLSTPSDLFDDRKEGLWVKVPISISGDISLHPSNIYSLRFQRKMLAGPDWEIEDVKDTDVIVQSGGFSAVYNARQVMSRNFTHQAKGPK